MDKANDKEKNKKISYWVVALILVVIIIFLLIWLFGGQDQEQQPTGNENVPVYEVPSANNQFREVEVEPGTEIKFSITNLARSYAERFGSWSTDNQLKNLEQLLSLSTRSMQNYLQTREANTEAAEFYGVTTKALSAEILNQSESSALVVVSTQRLETKGETRNTFYQDIEIGLTYSGDQWLVNSATWQ